MCTTCKAPCPSPNRWISPGGVLPGATCPGGWGPRRQMPPGCCSSRSAPSPCSQSLRPAALCRGRKASPGEANGAPSTPVMASLPGPGGHLLPVRRAHAPRPGVGRAAVPRFSEHELVLRVGLTQQHSAHSRVENCQGQPLLCFPRTLLCPQPAVTPHVCLPPGPRLSHLSLPRGALFLLRSQAAKCPPPALGMANKVAILVWLAGDRGRSLTLGILVLLGIIAGL